MSWNFIYDSPTEITKLLNKEGLAMSKKFGQNFLISTHAREKLSSLVDLTNGEEIWEIGPGLGALTSKLLEKGAKVKAFEIDYGFCRILTEQAFKDEKNFTLISGDALKTLFTQEDKPSIICGNLPYNIGSVCIAKLIENSVLPKKMFFTLQKEVAQRICSGPGDKNWSSLSILCQTDYSATLAFNISPNSFYPEPKVESSVVVLEKLKESKVSDEVRPIFLTLIRDMFAQRRKTISNNLKRGKVGSSLDKVAINSCLEKAGIKENERSENIEIEKIIQLANNIKKMQCQNSTAQ